MPADGDNSFVVGADDVGETLAAIVRRRGVAASWRDARAVVTSGKVSIDGRVVLDPVTRPRSGAHVDYRPRTPRVEPAPGGRLVHEDAQLVVFDKPAGASSVPYEDRERGTAMDLIRAHWRRAGKDAGDVPLHVVHRIDKDTSGLICFAKTKTAERAMQALFREHDVERSYLCVVHGHLTDRRIESRMVADRGDGLRGSTRELHQGKRAVTHVWVREPVGPYAMLCEVRLETGKTHQIRIHLAENGHPIAGERVYVRDFEHAGHTLLPSPRLLLHAATLGFVHPVSAATLRFASPLPEDFTRAVARLARAGPSRAARAPAT